MWQMPFTNDEGAYLYDAKTILEGRLPGGDVITKSPVVIMLFSLFAFLTGTSLYSARLASLFFGLATIFPLLAMAYVLFRKHLMMTAIIWLVFSTPVVLMGFGHTESVAVFFAALTIALLLVGLRRKKFVWWFFLSGVSFALAVGSRKTNLVLLVPLIIFVVQNKNKTESLKIYTYYFCLGFVVIMALLSTLIFSLYGTAGLDEFVGNGYTRIIKNHISGDSRVDIWGITIFDATKILSRIATAHIVLVLLGIGGIIINFAKLKKNIFASPMVSIFLWSVALVILYSTWPTFLPDYAADFLVPVSLLGVWVTSKIWKQNILFIRILVVACFCLLNVISYLSIFMTPWTGMFTAQSSKKMAIEMVKLIPKDEPVLTAAVIIPYLSGHKTLFNISHPLWYRYEFIADDEKNIFLPPWEKVASAIKNGEVGWILMEHLTDYAYFRNFDQLINEMDENWELVTSVPNNTGFRSNTLKLYRRK